MGLRGRLGAAGGIAAEAAIIIAAYLAYNGLRIVVEGGHAQAVEHALNIVALEQSLGIFHEADVQRAVESQPWLASFMRWFYLWAYLPLLGAAGLVVYLRDVRLYRSYRNVLLVSACLGLVVFALLPVAPPRMLPEFGFWDSVHGALRGPTAAKNDFAAVPSFHFGFTLLAAVGVSHAFGFRPWLLSATLVAPALMLVAIVATANHFFVDAFAGGVLVMAVWELLVWSRGERRWMGAPGHAMSGA
jgi:hypothetical protein